MRIGNTQSGRAATAIAVSALLVTAIGGTAAAQDEMEPVQVCELAYYTGSFAAYGPSLTNDVRFAVEDVVNQDPPLGRTWELISEDIGDSFEGDAARKCIEQHGAEILVSIAHQYRNYRDYMMETWAENDAPLGPSVHGGAIPGNLGGKAAEPIFRAQGLDEALGTFGSLYAASIGAQDVVIFATEVEGFQLAADANEEAAMAIGLNVLERINAPADQASYRADAEKIANLDPDAVLVQAGSTESATLIKAAAEAGLSLNWIGETGWSEAEFIGSLGADPIATQQGIGFTTFAPNLGTPAWESYQPMWDAQTNCTDGVADCPPYDASNQYAFSTYDLIVQTALAVEAAGSYNASEWAPAMHAVGDAPGEVCYTYFDCLALIREGMDIDYEGVTGPGLYSDGGVNAVTPAYLGFNADGTIAEPVLLDAATGLEILEEIRTNAECDPADPPNECTW
jgi:branched-chain amino acid transport system substrate-binding protein